ncbi:hypothetical protein JCM10212_004448 [Sporobolomyces blumeae]
MPSALLSGQELYLGVDAGGTAVKVVVVRKSDGAIGRAEGGPCNVKSVGPEGAMERIVKASWAALRDLPGPLLLPIDKVDPEPLHLELFARVWLGVAGLLRPTEVDAFRPFACRAFGFALDDERLRITNDGHLLAAPAVAVPEISSTVVLVAGTGSVSLAFRKHGHDLELVGLSGGWGYLIGDEGSAFCVGRLAIQRLMLDADAAQSRSFVDSTQSARKAGTPSATLPLFSRLLDRLDVAGPAELIDQIYSDQSQTSTPSTFSTAETRRKLWIASGSRVVFEHAFERSDVDAESRRIALEILDEAVIPLVDAAVRLVGDRSVVDPSHGSLSLGGGLWNSEGYVALLLDKLKAQGVEFAQVSVVRSAAEEGARALVLLDGTDTRIL